MSIAALAGCGTHPAGPDSDVGELPSQPCSELARVIHRWQGNELDACGGFAAGQRELLPIADGYVLEWTPTTGRHQLWAVGDALPLGPGPLMTGLARIGEGEGLYPLGTGRVVRVNLLDTGYGLYAVDLKARGSTGTTAIYPQVGHGTWGDAFWGYELVTLDDGHVLKWWSGTGDYTVLQYEPGEERFLETSFRGRNDALRRGAKLVNLGAHRLLEWIPVTGQYRIWAYSFNSDGPEIFLPDPVFPPGAWTDVGRHEEILVVNRTSGSERLLVWDRDSGRVTLRTFDPLAPDPLGGSIVARADYPSLASPELNAPVASRIENVVIFLQRGRSFDSYFGRYCRAAPGAVPACENGASCCEAMPDEIPGADACAPVDSTIDDHMPNDDPECLATKIDGGSMDKYATAPGCGSPRDFACAGVGAEAGAIGAYHRLADSGAIADRFFQTTIDGGAFNADLNLIYLSKAGYGTAVSTEGGHDQLTFLMAQAGIRYAIYLGDPQNVTQRYGQLPPQFFDPHWTTFRAVSELERDIALEQLPAISIVVSPETLNEEPGRGPVAAGISFVAGLIDQIAASPRYQPTTLSLVAYLTSGGYFDHVGPPAPPPTSVDRTAAGLPIPYGPRVPLLATGRFARTGHVSHVPLELSSLTAFLEWNWQGGVVGQLGRRDAWVANLGSLLDANATGTAVPDGSR